MPSNFLVKPTNLDEVRDALNNIFAQFSENIFNQAGQFVRREAREPLRDAVVEAFQRTNVYSGLTGDGDLLAHIGLSLEDGSYAAESMSDTIRSSLLVSEIAFRGNSGRFSSVSSAITLSFGIKVEDLEEKLVNQPFADYQSNEHEIPWLHWLIFGGGVDASIEFGDYPNGRSGQAYMIPTAARYGPWSIDDWQGFTKSKNFILDMQEDSELSERVLEIVTESFRQAIVFLGG